MKKLAKTKEDIIKEIETYLQKPLTERIEEIRKEGRFVPSFDEDSEIEDGICIGLMTEDIKVWYTLMSEILEISEIYVQLEDCVEDISEGEMKNLIAYSVTIRNRLGYLKGLMKEAVFGAYLEDLKNLGFDLNKIQILFTKDYAIYVRERDYPAFSPLGIITLERNSFGQEDDI